jgi:hypothetical protein
VATELANILTPIQPTTVMVSNTTLFELAAIYFGDADMWNWFIVMNPQLVNADGFFEYEIGAPVMIAVPPTGQFITNGGILSSFPAPVAAPGRSFSNDFNFAFE